MTTTEVLGAVSAMKDGHAVRLHVDHDDTLRNVKSASTETT